MAAKQSIVSHQQRTPTSEESCLYKGRNNKSTAS